MADVQILAAREENIAAIRIIGRASFKVSEQLRDYGLRMIEEGMETVLFELSECEGMDSTILGVFAMIGLQARGKTEVVILNASEPLYKAMQVVGVSRLFRFANQTVEELNWKNLCEAAAGAAETQESAGTILDAHRTLMDLDENNVPKFKDVVELLEKEVNDSDGN